MIIIPERRHPNYPEEPVPIDDPYLPEDPGDEPDDRGVHAPEALSFTNGSFVKSLFKTDFPYDPQFLA